MTDQAVIDVAQRALFTAIMVAGPILLLGLATGLVVGLFQAVTQINEQTLAFVPKILVVMAATLALGPWMLGVMTDFTRQVLQDLPKWVR